MKTMSALPIIEKLSKGLRAYVILAAITLSATLIGIFTMPVIDRDEARFAQASAQMLETGDYIEIRFHDGARNKKPAGIHWSQALSVTALSSVEAREIWAYRIPSIIGVVMGVLMTFWAGTALLPRVVAFTGAGFFSTTLLLTSEAHISKTDGMLIFLTTMAIGALAHLRHHYPSGEGGKALSLIFWIGVGGGTLMKGPITPMVVGLTLLALYLWEGRRLKQPFDWLKPLRNWPGPLIAAILFIPWLIAIQQETSGAFLRESVGEDFGPKLITGTEGHYGPPGYHTAFLSLILWPATLFILPGIVWLIQTLRRKLEAAHDMTSESSLSAARFLACWIVPSYFVFEAVATKLPHYSLPTHPALCLAGAAALWAIISGHQKRGISLWVGAVIFLAIGSLLALLTTPLGLSWVLSAAREELGAIGDTTIQSWLSTSVPSFWPLLMFAIFIPVIVSISAVIGRKWQTAIFALVISGMVTGLVLRAYFLPRQDWLIATRLAENLLIEICAHPTKSVLDKHCEGLDMPTRVQGIGFAEPSWVFRLRGRVELPPASSTTAYAGDARPSWVLNRLDKGGENALKTIRAETEAEGKCLREADGYAYNYADGNPVHLVAIVIENSGCSQPYKINS